MARVKKKDVAQYCYVCQLVGKPNQLISLAKLSHLPVIREPFKHVFVDCVGPLSKTKSGKQFLFTIMCVVARFLEANPLRKITVPIIMLVKFFSTFKLPKIVQTDKGTFLSKLFKQALKSLTLTHRFSSVYHLQSQGAFKSFHQTFNKLGHVIADCLALKGKQQSQTKSVGFVKILNMTVKVPDDEVTDLLF